MEITSVRIRRAHGDQRVKAAASICLDGQFVVHDLRVIEGPNGLFVSMPARKTGSGDYRDIAHPVTAEARELIQKAVLEAYRAWLAAQPAPEQAAV